MVTEGLDDDEDSPPLKNVEDDEELELEPKPKLNLESRSLNLSEVTLYSLVVQAIEPEPSCRFAD